MLFCIQENAKLTIPTLVLNERYWNVWYEAAPLWPSGYLYLQPYFKRTKSPGSIVTWQKTSLIPSDWLKQFKVTPRKVWTLLIAFLKWIIILQTEWWKYNDYLYTLKYNPYGLMSISALWNSLCTTDCLPSDWNQWYEIRYSFVHIERQIGDPDQHVDGHSGRRRAKHMQINLARWALPSTL